MNLFYESIEDYAMNLRGPIVDAALLASTLENFMDGDDIYDYIVSEQPTSKASDTDIEEEEYREDRYEQMAARHHCWRK